MRAPVRFLSRLFTTGRVLRACVLLLFCWAVGRHWHEFYGFTTLLQIDATMAENALPVIRDQPVYVYPDRGPYDGGYYAQIATSPGLRDPALRSAIDDLGYRARRILLPAIAWGAGLGDPVAAMRSYAWLNLVAWLAFALVLARILPGEDARAMGAWVLFLAGAGVLFSVRLALTDLAATWLTAVAVAGAERGRLRFAGGWLGLAGLTRETAILGIVALLPGNREAWRARWRSLVVPGALALVPLVFWLWYVRQTVGESGPGQRNLAAPFFGWANRWRELAQGEALTGNPRLVWESALEHVALTVQLVYLAWRRRWECPWWRVGAAYGVLALLLGPAVWGGFPNAASRVLLPMTLVFFVRVVRDRARWAWFVLGGLSVFAGVHAIEAPPAPPHALPAGSSWHSRQLLETDARWSVAEWNRDRRWAWCADSGGLVFRAWPWPAAVRLQLQLRGLTPRPVEVRHAGRVVWSGDIGDRPQWIALPELPCERGRLELEVRSVRPGTAEGSGNTARRIGVACFGARVGP